MDNDANNTLEAEKKTSVNESSSSSPKRVGAKGYNGSKNHIKNNSNEKDIFDIGKYTKSYQKYIGDRINKTNDTEENYEEYVEAEDSMQMTEILSKNNDSSVSGTFAFFKNSKKRNTLFGIVGGILFIFLLLIVIMISSKNPVSAVASGDENPIITELKTKIKEVKSKIRSEYGVSIDEKLVLATLIAYYDNEDDDIDISYVESKIELLAKYQIMTKAKCDYDSSTIRKIASNDKKELFSSEEKNYKCDSTSEEETYELSTDRGNYKDDNSGGVYYWNLIDGDFIKDYYSDFVVSSSEEEKEDKKTIQSIVEDIYDYYEIMPDDEEGGICGVVYAECPGVTVTGYGTYDLETYVAGVLAAEPGATMTNDELGKFNAIIIRSYTLAHTNNCKNPISSSSNEQNFSTTTDTYKKYAEDTAGVVMTDTDGKIIDAVYSLAGVYDCIPTNGKCKFQRCTRYADSISECSGKVTEFLVPYGTITYSDHDIHYGGSEPYIAQYYSEHEGYTYDMLLKAFYGDDITLAKLSSSTSNLGSSCGLSDASANYWWPIGSKEIETIAGKEFAKGEPQTYWMSNGFGCGAENAWRTTGCHGGQDIALDCGSNVIAAKGGTVVYTNNGCPTYGGGYGDACGGGYGNHVMIEHSDGNYTLYAHMTLNSLRVSEGDTVTQGQVVGLVGSSGSSTGCHLHFEVREGEYNRINPLKYVDPKNPRP